MADSQDDLALVREDIGSVTVLRVGVPILRDDETINALFGQATALVRDEGRPRLVLNLDGVIFLASVVLGKLATLVNQARAAGGKLAVCRVTRTIEELLQITHLADILPIYADEQEAVRSFH
jgi:anti-anti-sigma factor